MQTMQLNNKLIRLKTTLITVFFALIASASFAQVSSGNPLPETGVVDCNLYIPNAFTPNGDGNNDTWGIRVNERCELVEFTLRIVDRWGRKVFEVDDHEREFWWDGTFDGTQLNSGVYVYQITARFNPPDGSDTQLINRQGSITLIR